MTKCHTTLCRGEAGAELRGLCMKCYSAAKKMVENNKSTWEELEEMGLCVSQTNPFDAAFAKRKASS